MTTGQLILNGISDPQLEIIIQLKAQQETIFHFQPEQMRPQQKVYAGPAPNGYDNVILSWTNDPGFKVILELLTRLNAAEQASPALSHP